MVYNKLVSEKKKAIISIIIASLCSGGTGIASKFALHDISPVTFTFLRFFIGSIVITPLLLKEGKIIKPTFFVILISFLMVINPSIYTFGIHLTSVTIGQTLFSATPIATALFAFLIYKQTFTLRKTIGIFLGFIGAIIIILLPVIESHSAFSGNFLGNLFICVSVVSLALYSVLTKKLQDTFSPIYLTALFIYSTAIVNFFLAIPEIIQKPAFLTSISVSGWLGLIYAGSFGIFFFLFYQYAIKHGSAVIASTSNYLSPVVAFLVAFFLLSERLTTGFVIGAIFALVGVYLTTTSGKE